ncbi:hypothetical protein ALC62_05422 [Cyphomyrmex costatus]|uniref:Uncharacterized protein n=1 Tax=Cyphomyrmex costatus TaxID=456900 RepID=A0A195CSQ6_9HYME|nr:hypothetical protein ALC62_05422 [Cyphomyrmex costatus]
MRECLGCETYAKYTHTCVSSCAHFTFASTSVRASVFVPPSLQEVHQCYVTQHTLKPGSHNALEIEDYYN